MRNQGWHLDDDGWWVRPAYKRDRKLLTNSEWAIGDGTNAGIDESGMVFCRNAKQKARIDRGLPPKETQPMVDIGDE